MDTPSATFGDQPLPLLRELELLACSFFFFAWHMTYGILMRTWGSMGLGHDEQRIIRLINGKGNGGVGMVAETLWLAAFWSEASGHALENIRVE